MKRPETKIPGTFPSYFSLAPLYIGRMSCSFSAYIGFTVPQIDGLIASALEARKALLSGELVQRFAKGDLSMSFADGGLTLDNLAEELARLHAAREAALAAPDGLVPKPRANRAIFPWAS